MNHTLKQLLNAAPKELREAYYAAREECQTPHGKAEYDRDMEVMLMEQQKKERVTTQQPTRSPYTKRMDFIQTH